MDLKKISSKYRSFLRYRLNHKNRKRLKNGEFSIISSNCIGGVILHELHQRFDTPTIDLYLSTKDYLKFVKNLQYYLSLEVEPIESTCYLRGRLDDIILNFVHYHSFEEARDKWMERKDRVHFDNLYLIMADRDGCTDEDIREFEALSYPRKAFITYKHREGISSEIVIPGTEEGEKVCDVCRYLSKFTGKRWIDKWDYVDWLDRR